MVRTRRFRQELPVYVEPVSEGLSGDEIDNTNSSVIEVQPVVRSQGDNRMTKVGRERVRSRGKRANENNGRGVVKSEDMNTDGDQKQIKRAKKDEDITLATDSRSWIEKYAPIDYKDIAMHPKKLQEIRQVLEDMIAGTSSTKILLLTGPAGSGKSTAVTLLTEHIFEQAPESSNRFKIDLGTGVDSPYYLSDNIVNFSNSSTNTVNQFTDFLNECKMLTGPNLKLILVEELPNVFHLETKLKFQKALQEFLDVPYRLPPLCICLTENEFNDEFGESSYNIQNNYVSETIIGNSILNNNHLKRIKVNPIAKTYLKKALINIFKSEYDIFSKIPQAVLDTKVANLSINGDIRSAINCLEFWAKFYSKTGDEEDDFLTFGKENNLNLFNAIGKVIYGTSHEDSEVVNYKKLKNIGNDVLDQEKIDQVTIFNVLSNFSNKVSFFNLNLLENYAMLNSGNFPICDELCQFIENLSLADVLTTSGLSEISANTSVRSSRYAMKSIDEKIKKGIYQASARPGSNFDRHKNQKLKFTKSFKSIRLRNTMVSDIKSYQFWKVNKLILAENGALEDYGTVPTMISTGDAVLVDGFYEPAILNSRRYEAKLRDMIANSSKTGGYVPSSMIPKFPRIGGSFNNRMASDLDFNLEDDYGSFSKGFEAYKTTEDKLMSVLTEGFCEGGEASDDDSEFGEDPIDSEDEEVIKPSVGAEILADLEGDDSFEDENW